MIRQGEKVGLEVLEPNRCLDKECDIQERLEVSLYPKKKVIEVIKNMMSYKAGVKSKSLTAFMEEEEE